VGWVRGASAPHVVGAHVRGVWVNPVPRRAFLQWEGGWVGGLGWGVGVRVFTSAWLCVSLRVSAVRCKPRGRTAVRGSRTCRWSQRERPRMAHHTTLPAAISRCAGRPGTHAHSHILQAAPFPTSTLSPPFASLRFPYLRPSLSPNELFSFSLSPLHPPRFLSRY
jgi:hypothetical protein